MKSYFVPTLIALAIGACGHPDQADEAVGEEESEGTTTAALHGSNVEWLETRARDTVFQAGTFDDLATSHFTGEVAYGQVARHGDFGVGTMEHVDGEMIAIDGVFYSIKDDLIPRRIDPRTATPFAQVTFFRADSQADISNLGSFAAVQSALGALAPDLRTFYAFRAEGTFSSITIRSIHRQEEPYPPISQVIATQVTRTLTNARGTVLGFRTPAWAGNTAFSNYHFHFISADRSVAGHVLDVATGADVKVGIDDKHALEINLLGRDDDFGHH